MEGIVTGVSRNSDGKRIVTIKVSKPSNSFNSTFEIESGQFELDQPVNIDVTAASVKSKTWPVAPQL